MSLPMSPTPPCQCKQPCHLQLRKMRTLMAHDDAAYVVHLSAQCMLGRAQAGQLQQVRYVSAKRCQGNQRVSPEGSWRQQCGRLSQRLHHPLQLLRAHPQCHPHPSVPRLSVCPRTPALSWTPTCHCETLRPHFVPQITHPQGKASGLGDSQSRRQPHLPLRDAGGADLLQDLLELGIAHFCQKLPLWQHHIPAVVLYEVKRLIYGLQHMGDRIGTPSPALQLSLMPSTCRRL